MRESEEFIQRFGAGVRPTMLIRGPGQQIVLFPKRYGRAFAINFRCARNKNPLSVSGAESENNVRPAKNGFDRLDGPLHYQPNTDGAGHVIYTVGVAYQL